MPRRWQREHPATPLSEASHLTLSFLHAVHARPLRVGFTSFGDFAGGLPFWRFRGESSSVPAAEGLLMCVGLVA